MPKSPLLVPYSASGVGSGFVCIQTFRPVAGQEDPPLTTVAITHSSYRLSIFNEHLRRFLHSGDIIELSTSDPRKMPLPNIEIFEMQWILGNILALIAEAEPKAEDKYKDGDGDEELWLADDEGSSGNSHHAPPPPRDQLVGRCSVVY